MDSTPPMTAGRDARFPVRLLGLLLALFVVLTFSFTILAKARGWLAPKIDKPFQAYSVEGGK